MLFRFYINFLKFLFVFWLLGSKGFISNLILCFHIFEGIFYIEHSCMIHVQKRVKNFLLIFCILIEAGVGSSFITRKQQVLCFNYFAYVLFVPAFQFWLALILLCDIVKLKALKFKVELILYKLLHSMHIDLIELGYETGTDESMLEP